LIKRYDDGAVEFVELTCFGVDKAAVMFEGFQNSAGKGRIEFLEKLQINDTDTVTLGGQAIAAGFVESLNKAFGAEL